MSAPPSVDAPSNADQVNGADVPPAAHPDTDLLRGPSVELVEETDPKQARPDPARGVVPIGAVPDLQPPVLPLRRRLPGMPVDRLRGWIVTLGLTAIGAVIRLWHLGSASDGGTAGSVGTPLFDEKYYAVQAAEVVRNGGVEDNQAFGVIVHPPLGKQLIGLGEMLLGYNPTGWRISSAVAGIFCIFLIIRVVRRMTRSTLLGGIAGVLLICDSVSHVMARTSLLDIFQEVFVLAAFSCLIADRDQVRARLRSSIADPSLFLPTRGPSFWRRWGDQAGAALGARWWRFGCGFFLGLTTAVKWSGLYWILGFGILSVIWDITARRESGVRSPVGAVVRRDLFPSLWSLFVVPMATYVASWWAWFGSEDAFPRHVLTANTENWSQSPLLLKIAQLWDNSLWQWTWKMLDFHSHLLTPTVVANRHPWESKPWTWPLGTRPVLTYLSSGQTCSSGQTDCVGRIFIIALPMMWWLSLFVAAWALWKAIGRLDWRYAAVLVGYGSGYIPWFLNLDRQMYFFYVTPLAPFLVIGISLVLGDILGRAKVGVERRYLSVAVVAVYVGLVVADFVFMLPILNGSPITQDRLNMEMWLPSWG